MTYIHESAKLTKYDTVPTTSPIHASYILNKFIHFYSIVITMDINAADHYHI